MRELSVSLNPDSVQEVIDELNKVKSLLDGEKMDNALGDIAGEIAKKAREIYGPSVTVTVEPADHGKDVVASGKAVMFLEFGAGTMTDTAHPYAGDAPVEIRPGSYSETHAGMFASTNEDGDGYWIFGGKVYHYVVPRRALYHAVEDVKPKVLGIVKENLK